MKKYELVGEFEFFDKKFFQVKALIAFGNVYAGELGGYIEKEENLDQSGDAWVYGDARVSGNAEIMWISKIGSRFATLTIFKTRDGFNLATGCFFGTFDEFKKQVSLKNANDNYRKEYEALYGLIELRFGIKE